MDISRKQILVCCFMFCISTTSNFENKKNMETEKIILKTIMEFEGGDKLHQISGDAGGLTRWGIASASHPGVDVANLTLNEAVEIYKKKYWQPLKLDSILSDSIKWKAFDISVNMGVRTAARMLQEAVGLIPDGIVGQFTIEAINLKKENEIIDALIKMQIVRYAAICNRNESQYKFIKGWNKRAFSRFTT